MHRLIPLLAALPIVCLTVSACCAGIDDCVPAEPLVEGEPEQQGLQQEPTVDEAAPDAPADSVGRDYPEFAEIGSPAPLFTLADVAGESHSLADLRGKTVVLEWFNPECPFVVHAHEKGPLKEMKSSLPNAELIWLAINSGAPGKQGSGAEKNRSYIEKWSLEHAVLLDEGGAVGRSYQAKTTPHVYVIDPKGILVYRGALDNAPRGRLKGKAYINYLEAALSSLSAGRSVEYADTRPYGCSVKYGSQ